MQVNPQIDEPELAQNRQYRVKMNEGLTVDYGCRDLKSEPLPMQFVVLPIRDKA